MSLIYIGFDKQKPIVKVGETIQPKKRLLQAKTDNPDYRFYECYEVPNNIRKKLENAVHNTLEFKFKYKRIRNEITGNKTEWFECTPEQAELAILKVIVDYQNKQIDSLNNQIENINDKYNETSINNFYDKIYKHLFSSMEGSSMEGSNHNRAVMYQRSFQIVNEVNELSKKDPSWMRVKALNQLKVGDLHGDVDAINLLIQAKNDGDVYARKLLDHHSALEKCLGSINMGSVIGNINPLAITFKNCEDIKNIDKALQYYEYGVEHNDPESCLNLVVKYLERDNELDYDKALEAINKFLEVATDNDKKAHELKVQYQMGSIYLRKNDFDIAMNYFDEIIEKTSINREQWFYCNAINMKASIYLAPEYNKFNKDDINMSIELLKSVINIDPFLSNVLSSLYLQCNKFDEALTYHKHFFTSEDHTLNTNIKKSTLPLTIYSNPSNETAIFHCINDIPSLILTREIKDEKNDVREISIAYFPELNLAGYIDPNLYPIEE